MAGKQAHLIRDRVLARLSRLIGQNRYAARDRAILLLSAKAGLRACEIAGLTWAMVLDPRGQVGDVIELRDAIAKKGRGRTVPINPDLKLALTRLWSTAAPAITTDGPVIASERGGSFRASSIVNWFAVLYRRAGLDGCSSHSGRRTFITKAAR